MALPEEAKIYPSLRCALCGEKMMEPRARIKDGKIVCIPCFETLLKDRLIHLTQTGGITVQNI